MNAMFSLRIEVFPTSIANDTQETCDGNTTASHSIVLERSE
jgi:hypothetical protein